MWQYIIKRLLLIIPTLIGIMTLNFFIVQAAPGGPVEQTLAQLQGLGDQTSRITGASTEIQTSDYRGSQGLPPELIERIEKMYGFDKPLSERYLDMLIGYAKFDFGDSFFRDATVIELIIEKMPVSISLGLWSTLLIYCISIPLGIKKAVSHGSPFDVWTSSIIIIGYAIPGFLFAILLVVLFAGGSYFDWFPLRGLTSPNFDELSTLGKIADYFHHLALPLLAYTISSYATLTMLTKNSFLDEIGKQYIVTARAKGLTEKQVLYGHIFRNAMLIVISGTPGLILAVFFSGAMLIEVIFSLDGLGLMAFESTLNRDYPVMFGTLYIFSLLGLLLKLISDLTYVAIDPRIDFESREG